MGVCDLKGMKCNFKLEIIKSKIVKVCKYLTLKKMNKCLFYNLDSCLN